ncbi:hypothetical protein ATY81_01630 [Rhizobium sp. R72]|nr:hypothetical protein ATY81_01630 [Rhizobium sp. R72]OWW05762.1 hypothetical protein ATY80_01630 [Rhizobium sp. R711]
MMTAVPVSDSVPPRSNVEMLVASRAEITACQYGKESTNYSRTGLEHALRMLATILGRSMRTGLAMESLRQMRIRDGHVNSKIHNVILTSQDINIQVFAKQYVEIGKAHPKFTIFVSQDGHGRPTKRSEAATTDAAGDSA